MFKSKKNSKSQNNALSEIYSSEKFKEDDSFFEGIQFAEGVEPEFDSSKNNNHDLKPTYVYLTEIES